MTEKLQSILEAEGLSDLLGKFNEQGVTDSILGDLTDADLKELGADKLGERKRLLAAFGKSGGGGVAAASVAEESAPQSGSSGAASKTAATPADATKDSPWVNTLGMPFVPIPRFETRFCIWPVRVQDYEAYSLASGATYPQVGFQQESDHPIVSVSWNDAIGFCVWLTGKERSEGKIDEKAVYRLPTDIEWSVAVGLPHEPEATPQDRSGKIPGYPWGLRWPPPKGAGNFCPDLEVDSYEHTSPVGSFAANAFGLHDMGGNVWEWCMDWYTSQSRQGDDWAGRLVARGASWIDGSTKSLLSSFRNSYGPDVRVDWHGFRCVLVGESADNTKEWRPVESVLSGDSHYAADSGKWWKGLFGRNH
jgi:formylglycine-generating enzyme required for sulfatase activity